MKGKIKIILIFAFFSLLFQIAFAQGPERIVNSVRNFLDNAIRVGAVLGFLSLVWAGFLYLTSAGNVENINKAKKQVLATFVGLILLLGSWLLLRTIHPEFVGVAPVPLAPIPNLPADLKRPEAAYAALVEIPIETFLKGEEGEQSNLFNLDELRELKRFLNDEYLPVIEQIKQKFDELTNLINQCGCGKTDPSGGERACITEIVGEATACPFTQPTCFAEKCVGDPCRGVREQMGEKMAEIASYFTELEQKNNELREKLLPIKERMARFTYALNTMKNCPFDSIFSRDSFSFLLDYTKKETTNVDWRISRIPLFENIEHPRSNSFLDFYCPKTGFHYAMIEPGKAEKSAKEFLGFDPNNPFFELSPEYQQFEQEWKKIMEQTEEAESVVSPEYELEVSCPFSMPFGEMMDEFLKALGDLIKKVEDILRDSPEILPDINDYYQLTFECKPENCTPFCFCPPIPGPTGLVCTACVCECTGLNPCPPSLFVQEGLIRGKFNGIKQNINNFNFDKIEKWLEKWEEIEKEVRKREAALTKTGIQNLYSKYSEAEEIVGFEILASRLHYCMAHAMEVEAGWMLSPCDEYKEGCLTPEGKRVESLNDCKCQETEECRSSYPFLASYNCKYLAPAFWLAKLLGFDDDKCHFFNYFCCRPLEKK